MAVAVAHVVMAESRTSMPFLPAPVFLRRRIRVP
jgi:hypothetical protein